MKMTTLKERTPECRVAYLQGYQAGVRHAAEIAEAEYADSGWHGYFRNAGDVIAGKIWKLAGLAKIVDQQTTETGKP